MKGKISVGNDENFSGVCVLHLIITVQYIKKCYPREFKITWELFNF